MSTDKATEAPTLVGAEEHLSQTIEEAVSAELAEQRTRLNEREAALARAPTQVRRMTRAAAEKLGIWF